MSQQEILSPIYHLSQEVLDEIIDILACSIYDSWEVRRASLSSCALAFRPFVPRSRMYLFSRITLMDDTTLNRRKFSRIEPFFDILNAQPSIAGYVRELQLVVGHGPCSWLNGERPDVVKIFDMITTTGFPLEKLKIIGKKYEYRLAYPYLMIEGPLRNIVPNITSLSFERLSHIPAQLVSMCPNLQELGLIEVTFAEDDSDLARQKPNCPRIRRFITSVPSPTQRGPGVEYLEDRAHIRLSDLVVLTAYIQNKARDWSLEQKLIDRFKRSLEEVIIDIRNGQTTSQFFSINYPTLNLENVQSLHKLSLVIFVKRYTWHSEPWYGLSNACFVLRSLSRSSSRLRNLTLVFDVWETLKHFDETNWEPLREEIIGVSSSAQTCLVTLHMHYRPSRENDGQTATLYGRLLRENYNAGRALVLMGQKWFPSSTDSPWKVVEYLLTAEDPDNLGRYVTNTIHP